MFLLNVINGYVKLITFIKQTKVLNNNYKDYNLSCSGDQAQLPKAAGVYLKGLLKLIRSEEYAEHHPKAYMCLGQFSTSIMSTHKI